jgi:hypothetical protein
MARVSSFIGAFLQSAGKLTSIDKTALVVNQIARSMSCCLSDIAALQFLSPVTKAVASKYFSELTSASERDHGLGKFLRVST